MSSAPPPSPPPPPLQNDSVQIREVWDSNLEQEFLLIRDLVHKYPYIGMDTEFPGVVCRTTDSTSFYNYATLKTNVDMLKLIQIGLTFSDAAGNLPDLGTGVGCIWQFNFREFDLRSDPYASASIELLRRSGIDFVRNREHGVDARRFAELMMSSGVVLNDDMLWVTFHCAYDFAYLLKILTWTNLPDTQAEFVKLVKVFFPILYDIKHIMMFRSNLHGSLDKLSEILGVKRVGLSHQAGSDSMVTLLSFFKMKEVYFGGSVEKYAGVLYGLGR